MFWIVNATRVFRNLILAGIIVACQAQHITIDNVEWKMINLNGKDVSAMEPPVSLTLADGRISGYAGCNQYFGRYETKITSITFSQMGSTKMYCQDKMDVEDAFLKMLSEADTYSMKGKSLQLISKGKTVAEFTR